jgi:NAD(P)H-dependent flavin oxidoreductase YrpB (nitropropane dioxygenase family)
MSRVVLLDAGPLGMVAHPRKNPEIKAWMERLIRGGVVVALPELADYEVRRELLQADKPRSIHRLDTFKVALDADVILAAQAVAQQARGDDVVIATT